MIRGVEHKGEVIQTEGFLVVVTINQIIRMSLLHGQNYYAVVSLKSGDDVKTVQENLGHATASFTLDTYGHVTEKMKKDSADRMQAFIKSVSR